MFIVEFHPSEGGDDAAKFAEELATAVAKYTGMRFNDTGRVITLEAHQLSPELAQKLSSLAGNHRIKRVPDNEKRGRKHTSTVRIAVLNTAQRKTDGVVLNEQDVKEEFTRAGGPGGQHRNKTSTAVRLTHLPTGIMIFASEERSQKQNREVAWQRLREKLSDEASSRNKQQFESIKREQLENETYWTWFAYRNEVKRPDGRTAPYNRCISGKLDKILS